MNEFLLRVGNINQRITAGGHFAQSGAKGDQQVCFAHPLSQFGVNANTNVTDIIGVAVIHVILIAEGCRHWYIDALGKGHQLCLSLSRPCRTTNYHQRFARLLQVAVQRGYVFVADFCLCRLRRSGIFHVSVRTQHVFRQSQHHRPGAAGHGGVEGMADIFGDAFNVVNLADPFGHVAIHAAEINFLKGFALGHGASDLPDKQDHRC